MKILPPLLLAFALAACGAPPTQPADEPPAEHAAGLVVQDAWAAPTPAGVDVSAGYLVIINGTTALDRLLSATSPRAERVEIHEMSMDGAVMQMRAVEQLSIAAGETVTLAPGGMHLMFYGVATPFAEDETIPVQLTFEHAGVIEAALPVQRAGQAGHGGH